LLSDEELPADDEEDPSPVELDSFEDSFEDSLRSFVPGLDRPARLSVL
jgi:hypothetical protein